MAPLELSRILLRLVALLLLLPSCAASRTSTAEINARYRDVIEQRHQDYRIKPGDVLTVQLSSREALDLDQAEIKVRPDGRGDLFFLPNHPLAGKTVDEVRDEFVEFVRARAKDAEVSIQVTSSSEKVYLVGQFERPGTIDLAPHMTLAEAISAVGGPRLTGKTSEALLRRPFSDPAKPELYRIDLDDEEDEQLFLLPGDQVVLERTWGATVVTWLQEYVFFMFDFRVVYGLDI